MSIRPGALFWLFFSFVLVTWLGLMTMSIRRISLDYNASLQSKINSFNTLTSELHCYFSDGTTVQHRIRWQHTYNTILHRSEQRRGGGWCGSWQAGPMSEHASGHRSCSCLTTRRVLSGLLTSLHLPTAWGYTILSLHIQYSSCKTRQFGGLNNKNLLRRKSYRQSSLPNRPSGRQTEN